MTHIAFKQNVHTRLEHIFKASALLIVSITKISPSDNKPVLKNLNGEFKARELSIIVGPSGSGKSTLLNLLSGYNSKNVSGTVKVNGSLRDQKLFRHHSSYVMQDNLLHPLLTVREAMRFSANLKIGKEMSAEEKEKRVSLTSSANQLRFFIFAFSD